MTPITAEDGCAIPTGAESSVPVLQQTITLQRERRGMQEGSFAIGAKQLSRIQALKLLSLEMFL